MLKLFGGGKADHPLADPREAKRILDALPADDPYKALEELAHWLESVAVVEGFRPQDRIALLFSVDDAAQPRLRKLARDYAGAARPSRFTENRIWGSVHAYCKAAGLAFARAIDLFVQNAKGADAAKAQVAPLACRALRSLGQQVKWMHLRYGPMELSVWGIVNNIYAFAEARGVAGSACVPYPGGAETTAQREFLKVALFSASSPDSLLPFQADFVERLIGDHVARLSLSTTRADEHAFWVDLAQPMPAQRMVRVPPAAPGVRYLGVAAARSELEAQVERIRVAGRAPPELLQGALADTDAVLDVMRHLALHWSSTPPERRTQRHAVKSRLSVAHGLEAVFAALGAPGGDSLDFETKDVESWIVENVSAGGFGALVPQVKGDWLKVGTLLAMQPDGGSNWVVGLVRRVNKTATQQARIGIQTLTKSPLPAALAVSGTFGATESGVILRSPEPESADVQIVLKPGVFAPGQNLEFEAGGRQHVYLPQAVVERGEDYEIGRFREMIREA